MGLHLAGTLSGLMPFFLYFAGLAAFFASAFGHPEIGIYYIVPLLPLQTLRYKIHAYPLGAEWIDVILLGVMIGILRNRRTIFGKNPVRVWLIFMAVWSYISLWRGALFLNGPLPLWFTDGRMSDWKNYMVIFLLFFLALASIKNVKQMQVLLIVMCLSMAALNRNYINTMRHRDLSTFSYDLRDEGSMGYAGVNGLAALEAQFSVLLLGLYSVQRKAGAKLGYLLLLATCLVALTYTFSRGGYAAALVGSLFVGIMKNRKIILILLLFLVSWQMIVPNAVRERVLMTTDERGQLESSAGTRVTLWENALEIITGDPVFGTGFDTYRYMHTVGTFEDTHNYYVKVTLEMGFIGLTIFLGMLASIFSAGLTLFRTPPADDFLRGLGLGLAGMVIATIVANAFGDRWTYIEETGFMWVIAAMAIRGRRLAMETTDVEQYPAIKEQTALSGEIGSATELALGWNGPTNAK
jgi:O-antigen ligase